MLPHYCFILHFYYSKNEQLYYCKPVCLLSCVVHSLSHAQLFAIPWTAACPTSLSFTMAQSFLKLISIESVMPSNHLILCHLFLLLPSIFPSIRVFSNELALHIRWPKYWSINFSICLSYEFSGLIAFRIDWFDFGFFILAFSVFLSTFKINHLNLYHIFCHVSIYLALCFYVKVWFSLCVTYFFSSRWECGCNYDLFIINLVSEFLFGL